MQRYLKVIAVAIAVIASLSLTITQHTKDHRGAGITSQASHAAPQRVSEEYDLASLRVFTTVLNRVKAHYVEPERIDPKRMLLASLDSVEKNVAEVLVDESPDKSKVSVRIQDVERSFDLSTIDSPWSLSRQMKSIFRFMQPHLQESTEIQDVEYAAVNGMLSTLDPHSVLLKPEIYDEMRLSTQGQFGGLGILIGMPQGTLTVMNPMKGTPAARAGLKACDSIIKIGEESTVNMTLTQAVQRLRGEPGSNVDITILREGWDQPVRKTLMRDIIKVDSVTSRMLKKKVGYVGVSSFQGNTYSDLRNALGKLKREGMRGLILDLRGNPGGLLDQAIKISDLFLESGTILTTVGFAGNRRERKDATAEGTEPNYPIAVLVSGDSASASEIVAGALKNLDRAVIVGTSTFGKGSVQVLYDNDDGSALKLTIAQYLTPGDISIQSVGITPDLMTTPIVVRSDFMRLHPQERRARESDLSQHLTNEHVQADVKPMRTFRYLADAPEEDAEEGDEEAEASVCLFPERRCDPKEAEETFVEDFQIRFARDLLAQATATKRSAILSGAGKFFEKQDQEEVQHITEALQKFGVNWEAPEKMPEKTGAANSVTPVQPISVQVSTEPKGLQARACGEVKLIVTVKNDGTAPIYRLKAISDATNRLFSDHEFVFGRIDPGKSRSWSVPLKVLDAPTRVDQVTFKFSDAEDHGYAPHTVQLSILGVERPVFSYSYQLIDDIQGNLDGKVQRGEKVRLFIKVQNTGKGKALKTVTTLKNLSDVGIFIGKGRFILGPMEPGDVKTASFTFDVQPSFAMSNFKLELTVYDDGLREYTSEKLKFDVVDDAPLPQTAQGTIKVQDAQVNLYAWAASDAPVIGYAKRGTAFEVLGRYAGWYRVRATEEQPAFIPEAAVGPGRGPNTGKFREHWQVTPPHIVLTVPTNSTDKERITIRGTATDETKVNDVFVFVRNSDADIAGEKVFYQSNRHGASAKKMQFSADIPLWPGANLVTVFARENNDVQAKELVVIFRKEAKASEAKKIAAEKSTPATNSTTKTRAQ